MKHNIIYDFIICPCCGAQYLPCEIYVPTAFFGGWYINIDKDKNGRIIEDDKPIHDRHVLNNRMNVMEHYICDYCNTPFDIEAKVSFRCTVDDRHNFNKDYSVSLDNKPKILLDES